MGRITILFVLAALGLCPVAGATCDRQAPHDRALHELLPPGLDGARVVSVQARAGAVGAFRLADQPFAGFVFWRESERRAGIPELALEGEHDLSFSPVGPARREGELRIARLSPSVLAQLDSGDYRMSVKASNEPVALLLFSELAEAPEPGLFLDPHQAGDLDRHIQNGGTACVAFDPTSCSDARAPGRRTAGYPATWLDGRENRGFILRNSAVYDQLAGQLDLGPSRYYVCRGGRAGPN